MKNLDQLRQNITAIDQQILTLLSKRFEYVKEVGEYKKAHTLPIVDKQREGEILEKLTKEAKKHNLSETLVRGMWQLIFNESYQKEK